MSETIFARVISDVENGTRCTVDIKGRNLKLGKKYLIRNGEYNGMLGVAPMPSDSCLHTIEILYDAYKYSYPTERSDRKRKHFPALSVDELTEEQLVLGEVRDVAQAKLELYVLCCILNNSIRFDEPWFWRSNLYPELVIFKEWL